MNSKIFYKSNIFFSPENLNLSIFPPNIYLDLKFGGWNNKKL